MTGKPIVMREGRYGPYVTDGETNASLRKGDEVDDLTLERALELLAERRARGPAKPRRGAKKKAAPRRPRPRRRAAEEGAGEEGGRQEGRPAKKTPTHPNLRC